MSSYSSFIGHNSIYLSIYLSQCVNIYLSLFIRICHSRSISIYLSIYLLWWLIYTIMNYSPILTLGENSSQQSNLTVFRRTLLPALLTVLFCVHALFLYTLSLLYFLFFLSSYWPPNWPPNWPQQKILIGPFLSCMKKYWMTSCTICLIRNLRICSHVFGYEPNWHAGDIVSYGLDLICNLFVFFLIRTSVLGDTSKACLCNHKWAHPTLLETSAMFSNWHPNAAKSSYCSFHRERQVIQHVVSKYLKEWSAS